MCITRRWQHIITVIYRTQYYYNGITYMCVCHLYTANNTHNTCYYYFDLYTRGVYSIKSWREKSIDSANGLRIVNQSSPNVLVLFKTAYQFVRTLSIRKRTRGIYTRTGRGSRCSADALFLATRKWKRHAIYSRRVNALGTCVHAEGKNNFSFSVEFGLAII